MKLAPICLQLEKLKNLFTHTIIHTGQHYDYNLSSVFFKDLKLPKPDYYLGVGSASHAVQTAKIMTEFEKKLISLKPDLVLVFGDVNSTLACSVVCSKVFKNSKPIPVAHIEAGLRSFDNSMPEEINRIITDKLSQLLFVTEKDGVRNLINEGINKNRIFLVGDTMIDSIIHYSKKISESDILNKLNLLSKNYILITVHRPVNVDSKNNLTKIISILSKIAKLSPDFSNYKLVFPVHPRTLKMINKFGLADKLKNINNLQIINPAGYIDFIKLLKDSKFVLTDSGGIQEEATFLKIPCLTLRDSFERPETIKLGTNTLCELNESLILHKVKEIFQGTYKKGKIPKLMDGNASKRIVNVIKSYFFNPNFSA